MPEGEAHYRKHLVHADRLHGYISHFAGELRAKRTGEYQ